MDIDHHQSKLGKTLNKLGLIAIGIGMILFYFTEVWFVVIVGYLVSCVSTFTPSFVKHRGIIHSILFCVVYGFVVYLSLGFQLAVLSFVGIYSHLLGDKIPFKIL